jgi:hypothetical protein
MAVAFFTASCSWRGPSALGLSPGKGRCKSAGLISSTETLGSFLNSSTTSADAMLV